MKLYNVYVNNSSEKSSVDKGVVVEKTEYLRLNKLDNMICDYMLTRMIKLKLTEAKD